MKEENERFCIEIKAKPFDIMLETQDDHSDRLKQCFTPLNCTVFHPFTSRFFSLETGHRFSPYFSTFLG